MLFKNFKKYNFIYNNKNNDIIIALLLIELKKFITLYFIIYITQLLINLTLLMSKGCFYHREEKLTNFCCNK
jgi:hypothetical protein